MVRCLNCMKEYDEQEEACPYCGFKEESGEPQCLPPGTILAGRYIIGMPRRANPADLLYIGWDALFSRRVLIDEYYPASCVHREGLQVCPTLESGGAWLEGKKCFLKDGRELIAMDGCKGLLDVFAVFEENGTGYQVLDYPGEMTLRRELEREGPWELERVEPLVESICSVLQEAHRRGVYHGQLSLDCCYKDPKGRYLVGTFNQAGAWTGDCEDSESGPPGADADIFELAHIAGAALTGVSDWEMCPVDESLDVLASTLPGYVIDVLQASMSEEPEEWPGTVERFSELFFDEVTIQVSKQQKEQKEPKSKGMLWNKFF